MWDWNNNGRYDFQDSFIDYHIYKLITSDNKSQGSSTTDNGGCFTIVAVGLLILGIFIIFV